MIPLNPTPHLQNEQRMLEEQQTKKSVEEDNKFVREFLELIESLRDDKPQSALEEGRNRGSGR